ncbi:Fc.00g107230.m01.CDS01 [Cosmosporella sp. VM-42]
MPEFYYIEQMSYGSGDEITLHICWNSARIIVNIDRNSSPDAVENLHIDKYTAACLNDDDDEQDVVQDDFLDATVGAGEWILDQVVPPYTPPPPCDLHSNLIPEEFPFGLVAVGGR